MMRSPGLQPERTAVAWVRTCAALIVNALVLARAGLGTHGAHSNIVLLAVSAVLCAGALLLFLLSSRRQVILARRFTPARLEIGIVSVLTIIVGASATYAILCGT
ncbi:DUF202 domain-containing protein [Castellaniella sp. GW247-6E4]|uniref:DUF202 domain-containing protein n=1 Tax=Castellaniella sp. GW247-6E4 TaxID=3140380 RepID=UPI0033164772